MDLYVLGPAFEGAQLLQSQQQDLDAAPHQLLIPLWVCSVGSHQAFKAESLLHCAGNQRASLCPVGAESFLCQDPTVPVG